MSATSITNDGQQVFRADLVVRGLRQVRLGVDCAGRHVEQAASGLVDAVAHDAELLEDRGDHSFLQQAAEQVIACEPLGAGEAAGASASALRTRPARDPGSSAMAADLGTLRPPSLLGCRGQTGAASARRPGAPPWCGVTGSSAMSDPQNTQPPTSVRTTAPSPQVSSRGHLCRSGGAACADGWVEGRTPSKSVGRAPARSAALDPPRLKSAATA
jgi:hypothetical protein